MNSSNDKYTYTNYLKRCPECGAALTPRDKDCPGCEINLVGYNQKYNMADNLTTCAIEFDGLVKQNDELNKEIIEENNKMVININRETKIKLRLLMLVFAVPILLLIVIFAGLVWPI